MAYSDFTLPQLKQRFGLRLNESQNLFATIPSRPLPEPLAQTLERYLPLALNLNTEKARSELIIAPFLTELKLLHQQRISLFSGLEFNVDESVGLKGRCDYLLAGSPEQLMLTAPVCVLVEAKNENIIGGIPQCLAEMIAAERFNQQQGTPLESIYGVVTTGLQWRFLRLSNLEAFVDRIEYGIQQPEKLFGILEHIALR